MLFELITGDFLFEPRSGSSFCKDDDHLAQMIELLGKVPTYLTSSGKFGKKLFTYKGELRRIKGLHYWSLEKVLVEKYKIQTDEALLLASFLIQMLNWDPEKRNSAQEMLNHPWLSSEANYDYYMSEKEVNARALKKKLVDIELNEDEKLEFCEEDIENLVIGREIMSSESDSDFEGVDEPDVTSWKAKRNMAEGIHLNNSFTGPYPEDVSSLHVDTGANYQFIDKV